MCGGVPVPPPPAAGVRPRAARSPELCAPLADDWSYLEWFRAGDFTPLQGSPRQRRPAEAQQRSRSRHPRSSPRERAHLPAPQRRRPAAAAAAAAALTAAAATVTQRCGRPRARPSAQAGADRGSCSAAAPPTASLAPAPAPLEPAPGNPSPAPARRRARTPTLTRRPQADAQAATVPGLALPVPPDYADAPGLSEEARSRRGRLRVAFALEAAPSDAESGAGGAEGPEVCEELQRLEGCAWALQEGDSYRRGRVRFAVRCCAEVASALRTLRYVPDQKQDSRNSWVRGVLEVGLEVIATLGTPGGGTACVGGAAAAYYLTRTHPMSHSMVRFGISIESQLLAPDAASGKPAGCRVYHRLLGCCVVSEGARCFGALGHSRHPVLCSKPVAFPSLVALLRAYRVGYAALGHRVLTAKVGRALPSSRTTLPAPPGFSSAGLQPFRRATKVQQREDIARWMMDARQSIAAVDNDPVVWHQLDVDFTDTKWPTSVAEHERRIIDPATQWTAPVDPYKRLGVPDEPSPQPSASPATPEPAGEAVAAEPAPFAAEVETA